MDFYIQTGAPFVLNNHDASDSRLSEAIESVFPMETEDMILFWRHVGISLSYKYDISYMTDDILMLLRRMREQESGELLIHWLPDTFRADWKIEWRGETVFINAEWESLKGGLQRLLADLKTVEISKRDFVSEWKKLLEILAGALKRNGYDRSMKAQYDMLAECFDDIAGYGILYRNVSNSGGENY